MPLTSSLKILIYLTTLNAVIMLTWPDSGKLEDWCRSEYSCLSNLKQENFLELPQSPLLKSQKANIFLKANWGTICK